MLIGMMVAIAGDHDGEGDNAHNEEYDDDHEDEDWD